MRSRLTGVGHNAFLKVLGFELAELMAELWIETDLGNEYLYGLSTGL